MKLKKFLSILFIISWVFCNGCVNVFAMNTGFTTKDVSPESWKGFLSNINLLLVTEEPEKAPIKCFDVSDSEMIAVGFKTLSNTYISVYDKEGIFQYGYVFNCNQGFEVQWDGTNLIIYFFRSGVAASFDSRGNNIEVKEVENTVENSIYLNNSLSPTERIVNKNKYTIKNNIWILNIFAFSYSQVVKTDSEGNETILYDVSIFKTVRTIVVFTCILLFLGLIIGGSKREFDKAKVKQK